MQLTLTGEGTAMICDVPTQMEPWVHISWRAVSEVNNAEWQVSFGYPLDNNRVETALSEQGVNLPTGSRVASWTNNVYVSIICPEATTPAQLAGLIEQIMVRLHGVTRRADVEVALEME
jgi:hypothetical protein